MRPNIDPAVEYVCTRVTKIDEGEWRKLRRLVSYLKKTVSNVRIIGANSVEGLFTSVDAVFAIHDDMKIQTGGTMLFRHGTVNC